MGPALAVQLDHPIRAQDGVLLVAADPLVKLRRRPRPPGAQSGYQGESRMLDSPEGVCARQAGSEDPATSVLFSKGDIHRVQRRGGRLAAALVGCGDGPLADGSRVAGGHAQAVAGKALRSDG